jgi:hypothetical protein
LIAGAKAAIDAANTYFQGGEPIPVP